MLFVMIIHGAIKLINTPTPEIPVNLIEPPFPSPQADGVLTNTTNNVNVPCSVEHTPCTPQQSMITLFFMKQYVIDELRPKDYETIKAYLDENFKSSKVGGIYWIPLDQELLTEVQTEHTYCQPFYFAVALEPDFVAFELLVRTKNKMRCSCMNYATEKQRDWFIGFADSIFDKFKIKI